jgi:hypothetical protein
VVDLVRDQTGVASVKDRDAPGAVRVLVLDVERHRARDHAADIEEAETAFVLLVAWGLLDDDGVDERDRVLTRHLDESGSTADTDLRGGDAHALAKDVRGLDSAHGRGQLGDDSAGVFGFGW